MKRRLLCSFVLVMSLFLSSCGFHFVGEGQKNSSDLTFATELEALEEAHQDKEAFSFFSEKPGNLFFNEGSDRFSIFDSSGEFSSEGTINFKNKDIRLDDLLRMLAVKAKINLMIVQPIDKKVTLESFDNFEPMTLMEILVESYGYALVKDENIYRVVPKGTLLHHPYRIHLDRYIRMLADDAKINLLIPQPMNELITIDPQSKLKPLVFIETLLKSHGYVLTKNENVYYAISKRDLSADISSLPPKIWKRFPGVSNAATIELGERRYLPLYSVRVLVKIEGLRARTIVDHVFHNPKQASGWLEGRFHYRLPDQGTISYLAYYPNLDFWKDPLMGDPSQNLPKLPAVLAGEISSLSVDEFIYYEGNPFGVPKVAQVVRRKKAQIAYEGTTRRQIDPALLEWSSGNTFTTRIYPIAQNGHQRVVLAYEETLPRVKGECLYEFSLPQGEGVKVDFMLVSDKQYDLGGKFSMKIPPEDGFYHLSAHTNILPDKLSYRFPAPPIEAITATASVKWRAVDEKEIIIESSYNPQDRYTYARFTPDVPKKEKRGSSQALFLLDTSLSQESRYFGMSVQLIEEILQQSPEIKEFNIVFFNMGAQWWKEGSWLLNNSKEREKITRELQELILEGATNFEGLFQTLEDATWFSSEKEMDIFLLSNGNITWGEETPALLAKKWQEKNPSARLYSYHLGAEGNGELLHRLSDTKGHVFYAHDSSQISDLAQAHRTVPFIINKIYTENLEDVLFWQKPQLLYPGSEIILAARPQGKKAKLILEGTWLGEKKKWEYPFSTEGESLLAPRAFGEVAVRKMESLNDPSLEDTIFAFARRFNIPGKNFSLLMLESERDYKNYEIDTKETGSSEAMVASLIAKAKPHSSLLSLPKIHARFSREMAKTHSFSNYLLRALARSPQAPVFSGPCQLKFRRELDFFYREERENFPFSSLTYLPESEKRYQRLGEPDYLRCLSSLVEIDPRNCSTLRTVAYSLQEKGLFAYAIPLYLRILSLRPTEPFPYWNLAKCHREQKSFSQAALYYEMLLVGKWPRRFREIQNVIHNEYIRLIREKLKNKDNLFWKKRLKELVEEKASFYQTDLVVSIVSNKEDISFTIENLRSCKRRVIQGDSYFVAYYSLKNISSGKQKIQLRCRHRNLKYLNEKISVQAEIITRAGYPDEERKIHHLLFSLPDKAWHGEEKTLDFFWYSPEDSSR